ncbi:MAG: hypothetical protein LC676_08045 [Loktanella sp.]|nr:hypothetical protein [Loktanella sp.]
MEKTQKRIAALDDEIAKIDAEIVTLTAQHAKQVQAGQDQKADSTHEQITGARERKEAAEMRRAPLMRVLEAEEAKAQAEVAAKLTADADAMQTALEAKLQEVAKAAAALAKVMDGLDEHAALHWSIAARKAVDAGGAPTRKHIAGIPETAAILSRAARLVQHVGDDHSRRSVQIPVTTKSRAA